MHLLSFTDGLPVVIMMVDSAERIRAFLPQLDELIGEGMAMLDEVEVIRYTDRGSGRRTS